MGFSGPCNLCEDIVHLSKCRKKWKIGFSFLFFKLSCGIFIYGNIVKNILFF